MSFRNFSFMKKYLVCQKPKCNVSTFLQNRVGRADGSCHTRKCDFLDNQLRTVGDYLGTFEEFLSQIFNSISESLSFGKWFFFFILKIPDKTNILATYIFKEGHVNFEETNSNHFVIVVIITQFRTIMS